MGPCGDYSKIGKRKEKVIFNELTSFEGIEHVSKPILLRVRANPTLIVLLWNALWHR
jgi:hypothetical protein